MFYASGLFSTIVILTKRFFYHCHPDQAFFYYCHPDQAQRVEGSRLYFPLPFPMSSG